MTPAEIWASGAEEKLNKRLRQLATQAIEAGLTLAAFIRLTKHAYRQAYYELELEGNTGK
jgi:hypothetical protein